MSIDDSSLALIRQMRAQISRIEDLHTRTVTAAWVRAWDDTRDDLALALDELATQAGEKRITRTAAIKSQRLTNALAEIETRLADLFEQSGQQAVSQLHDIVNNAGATTEALIASQLPEAERALVKAWSKVSGPQIEAIVKRTTEQITAASKPLSAEVTAGLKRELVRGIVAGKNPRDTAARILKRANQDFDGGLARALTIARTESLDAQRSAAAAVEQQNTDVLAGWVWTATLSSRTCPACWSKNGELFPLDEPGPQGHQNCRCARVPQTKSWKDLGFDIDEPPSEFPDAETQFDSLSSAEQLEVLGRGRYDAWRAGDFPMSDWAVKRENPGWRDSFVPAPVPR